MRQLKYHEKKLLRKVDFLQWKREHSLREIQASILMACSACVVSRLTHSPICIKEVRHSSAVLQSNLNTGSANLFLCEIQRIGYCVAV